MIYYTHHSIHRDGILSIGYFLKHSDNFVMQWDGTARVSTMHILIMIQRDGIPQVSTKMILISMMIMIIMI